MDQERKNIIISLLKTAVPELYSIEDPLKLAVAVFSCNKCDRDVPLCFPDVLGHRCTGLSLKPEEDPGDLYLNTLSAVSYFGPQSLSCWEVDTQIVGNLFTIIKVYGLDPLKTTQEELDVIKGRLTCVKCMRRQDSTVFFEAFDWLRALGHLICWRHRIDGIPCELQLLSTRMSEAVCNEEKRLRDHEDLGLPRHLCLGYPYCPQYFHSKEAFREHFLHRLVHVPNVMLQP
ncbi:hypothetical protein BD413DRAFT_608200 [Trametes elegans]|nr:hypothetical protein BD413DRAFT_608200 [Trametes elegans]